jgi:hypothetical protein
LTAVSDSSLTCEVPPFNSSSMVGAAVFLRAGAGG